MDILLRDSKMMFLDFVADPRKYLQLFILQCFCMLIFTLYLCCSSAHCFIVVFQVRWADINERQNQKRMRDVGFVVGQTDWSRMMDDTHATQALNRTKFI